MSGSTSSNVAKQHSAAASLAGFLFQLDIALFWLSESPIGAFVGIETLDDVAIVKNGVVALGQSKLSYSRNQLSDFNPNLWKTLSIWLKLLIEESVDLAQAEFHLISNFEIRTGWVAALKQARQNTAKIETAAKRLRALAKKAPASCRPFAKDITAAPQEILVGLLNRVGVYDGLPSHPNDQMPLFAQKLGLTEAITPPVVRGLRGWVQEQAESKFAEKQPAWLERDAFCEEKNRLVALHFEKKLILRAAEEIDVAEAASRLDRNATFLQQLRWIDVGSDEVLDAINDYLRSADERTRLADANNISKRCFSAFETNLLDRWKNIHRQASDDHPNNHKMAGRKALRSTLEHREMLDGQLTSEYYLTRGTYHKLADGKKAHVGWHPNFRKLLSQLKPKSSRAHD